MESQNVHDRAISLFKERESALEITKTMQCHKPAKSKPAVDSDEKSLYHWLMLLVADNIVDRSRLKIMLHVKMNRK